MSDPRGASVLRDDVRQLLSELKAHYIKKIDILQSLRQKDIHNRYLLKTGNMDELLDAVIEGQSMLDEIDGIDFEIAQVTRRIGDIAGMDTSALEHFLSHSDEPEVMECLTLRTTYLARLQVILADRNEIFLDMEKAAALLLKDADELKKIRRINLKKNEKPPLS